MLDKLFRTKPTTTDNHSTQPGGASHAHDRTPDRTSGQAHFSASDTASTDVTVTLSGREIANDNEREVLLALHKFGWLTSRQVAAWVWTNCSQQVQMSRRTLNRLKKLGQLLTGTLPNGVPIYSLSASGAARLGNYGIHARSGKDIRVSRWQHRAICNWHAILLGGYGYEVSSEHELYAGRAPIRHWCGKLADVIGTEHGRFRWVEVEHSRRKPSDMRKLLHLLMHGPLNPNYAHDMILESIELVTTNVRLMNAIAAALEREMFRQGMSPEDQRTIWGSVVGTELQISPGLVLTDHFKWSIPLRYHAPLGEAPADE